MAPVFVRHFIHTHAGIGVGAGTRQAHLCAAGILLHQVPVAAGANDGAVTMLAQLNMTQHVSHS